MLQKGGGTDNNYLYYLYYNNNFNNQHLHIIHDNFFRFKLD